MNAEDLVCPKCGQENIECYEAPYGINDFWRCFDCKNEFEMPMTRRKWEKIKWDKIK